MAEQHQMDKIKQDIKDEIASDLLQKLVQFEPRSNSKVLTVIFSILVLVFIMVMYYGYKSMNATLNEMYTTYIKNTEDIIRTKRDIELSNAWERLPVNQRRERLREQYYQIVKYYTNTVPDEQKMSNEQILQTFNQLWNSTESRPAINFFLPVAYMRIATNFNPVYNVDYKRGLAGFYIKVGENISNLPLVKADANFHVAYNGAKTLNNPLDAVRLLVARTDDLMVTFNNREDWVLMALFTNEYTVIEKYWEGGKGEIPDSMYETGQLAAALNYYYAFKNWQIPAIK